MPRKANTRAASGAGSIRQRPDGRWEARVTVGNDPGTGKPIRRSIYGETQAAVRKQMTAILREIDRGTYLTPQKTTVAQWLDEWLDDIPSLSGLYQELHQAADRRYRAASSARCARPEGL